MALAAKASGGLPCRSQRRLARKSYFILAAESEFE
jgi:hypothetical protein